MNNKRFLFFLAYKYAVPLPLDRDCFDLGTEYVCMHPFICPGCIAAKSKEAAKKANKGNMSEKMALVFGHAPCLFSFSFSPSSTE